MNADQEKQIEELIKETVKSHIKEKLVNELDSKQLKTGAGNVIDYFLRQPGVERAIQRIAPRLKSKATSAPQKVDFMIGLIDAVGGDQVGADVLNSLSVRIRSRIKQLGADERPADAPMQAPKEPSVADELGA